jgi:hypothetical protein
VRPKREDNSQVANQIDVLYHDLLGAFYEDENHERARSIAKRLEAILKKEPDVADSIRGQEIRSIIAELAGNLDEAIRCRQREIREIQELHRVTQDTPAWDYALRQYDYSDLSDRLDLLAILYADQGDLKRAVDTLNESKQFCEAHHIEFDGQDLLEEFRQAEANAPQRIPQA